MKSIRVTGKGLIRVHPDMTRILITLEGLYPEYGKTLKHSSKDTEAMRDAYHAGTKTAEEIIDFIQSDNQKAE